MLRVHCLTEYIWGHLLSHQMLKFTNHLQHVFSDLAKRISICFVLLLLISLFIIEIVDILSSTNIVGSNCVWSISLDNKFVAINSAIVDESAITVKYLIYSLHMTPKRWLTVSGMNICGELHFRSRPYSRPQRGAHFGLI